MMVLHSTKYAIISITLKWWSLPCHICIGICFYLMLSICICTNIASYSSLAFCISLMIYELISHKAYKMINFVW